MFTNRVLTKPRIYKCYSRSPDESQLFQLSPSSTSDLRFFARCYSYFREPKGKLRPISQCFTFQARACRFRLLFASLVYFLPRFFCSTLRFRVLPDVLTSMCTSEALCDQAFVYWCWCCCSFFAYFASMIVAVRHCSCLFLHL